MREGPYTPGDWNAVCFRCGRKRKASELKKHWQGYYVCPMHWEPREAQDFVKAVPDNQTPPFAQPKPVDLFIGITNPLETETSDSFYGNFDYILTEGGETIFTEN